MLKKDIKFDVAVVGGGPAGIMSAIKASEMGLSVVLLEKNKELGKKLLLTGNGRCNLTNAEFNLRELVKNYNNGEFLFHAFSVFGPKELIEFLESIGIKTKIEAGKRVFPKSNDAQDVLDALKKCLEKNNVKIIFGAEVIDVEKRGKIITKLILADPSTGSGQAEIVADKYIFTTGGKSYSATGSNGSGYKLAEKLGHKIVEPKPALTPIKLKQEQIAGLQGISLKNVKINGQIGEIIFTHFGISGPAVMDISADVKEKVSLDLFYDLNQEEILKELEITLKKYLKKSAKNILCELFPERVAEALLLRAKIDKEKIANNMSKIEKIALAKLFKNLEFDVEGVLGFEQAYVTRGGVTLAEINHKTMKSKIIDNLYFAGEIIDVDGKTGGFNLQMCWTTGYNAVKG